jgi:hypothetical protein
MKHLTLHRIALSLHRFCCLALLITVKSEKYSWWSDKLNLDFIAATKNMRNGKKYIKNYYPQGVYGTGGHKRNRVDTVSCAVKPERTSGQSTNHTERESRK